MKRTIVRSYELTRIDIQRAVLEMLRAENIPVPNDQASSKFTLVGDPAGISPVAAFLSWTDEVGSD